MGSAESPGARILLIDPSDPRRDALARRLRAQGYAVEVAAEPSTGADLALSAPPAVVIADLWMPSISGVQLCRLLRSEPATADVPVILCGDRDEPRNRFWSERAGASAYVVKGRTAELMRALVRAVESASKTDGFFVQLGNGSVDIRDRIARHLDAALFDSVIAAELRALASAGSLERLFDLLAQLLSQVTRYRWMALSTSSPGRLALHHHLGMPGAEAEARRALGTPDSTPIVQIDDEDAAADQTGPDPIVCTVSFGQSPIARFAISPCGGYELEAASLASLVGRELGGAVRVAALVEESQRLATIDSLTELMNRRAFSSLLGREIARSSRYGHPLCFCLLDVDHFKQVNDRHGHSAGDRVLSAVGRLLGARLRASDAAARWGGEEFVVAYTSTDLAGGRVAAERLRQAVEELVVEDDHGKSIPITVSIGVAALHAGEALESLVNRGDRAMYTSKSGGRNRVSVCVTDATGPDPGFPSSHEGPLNEAPPAAALP